MHPDDAIAALHARARRVRGRVAKRAWSYRQRHLAAGVWDRLRRLLAGAESAFAIAPEQARLLIEEGVTPEPVGAMLEPPRTILVVDAGTAARIPQAVPLPVRLDARLLSSPCLVLVRFESPT